MITTQTIAAATVLDTSGPIMNGKGRYQIELDNGTHTGTATIEVDFGAGYRTLETVDLTDTIRIPWVIEAEVLKMRITPSASMTLAVAWERA
jgi:hypothetical protein